MAIVIWRNGYLNYLYSAQGQELAAKYNFRPRNAQVVAKYSQKFPKQNTFTIDKVFGGWAKAQKLISQMVQSIIKLQLRNRSEALIR